MTHNIGQIERGLRIVTGAALMLWATWFHGPGWAWFGMIPLATGLIQWCPLYTLIRRLRRR